MTGNLMWVIASDTAQAQSPQPCRYRAVSVSGRTAGKRRAGRGLTDGESGEICGAIGAWKMHRAALVAKVREDDRRALIELVTQDAYLIQREMLRSVESVRIGAV